MEIFCRENILRNRSHYQNINYYAKMPPINATKKTQKINRIIQNGKSV